MSKSFANTLLVIVALAALFVVFFFYLSVGASYAPDTALARAAGFTELAGEKIRLEVVATNPTRYRGMSGRDSFLDGWGMLFAYPEEQVRIFCMRDCLIDIDILFLNRAGKIVAMHEMKREGLTDPERLYSSDTPAMYALELRAGTIKRLHLKPGMTVSLHNVPPPHTAEYE